MSRHTYQLIHENTPTIVLMGWDKPSQEFFMVISKPDVDEDEPYYSNLYERESHPKSLLPFLAVLKQKNIFVPPEMIEQVMNDCVNDAGNKDVTHYMINGMYRCENEINEEAFYNNM